MEHSLLIWELVPEDTELYLIPDEIAAKYKHFLQDAHNKLINVHEMNDGLKFLNHALSSEFSEEDGFEQYTGVLVNYKINKESPLENTYITSVYFSGFTM